MREFPSWATTVRHVQARVGGVAVDVMPRGRGPHPGPERSWLSGGLRRVRPTSPLASAAEGRKPRSFRNQETSAGCCPWPAFWPTFERPGGGLRRRHHGQAVVVAGTSYPGPGTAPAWSDGGGRRGPEGWGFGGWRTNSDEACGLRLQAQIQGLIRIVISQQLGRKHGYGPVVHGNSRNGWSVAEENGPATRGRLVRAAPRSRSVAFDAKPATTLKRTVRQAEPKA